MRHFNLPDAAAIRAATERQHNKLIKYKDRSTMRKCINIINEMAVSSFKQKGKVLTFK